MEVDDEVPSAPRTNRGGSPSQFSSRRNSIGPRLERSANQIIESNEAHYQPSRRTWRCSPTASAGSLRQRNRQLLRGRALSPERPWLTIARPKATGAGVELQPIFGLRRCTQPKKGRSLPLRRAASALVAVTIFGGGAAPTRSNRAQRLHPLSFDRDVRSWQIRGRSHRKLRTHPCELYT